MGKRTNKSTIWGLPELVGEISLGALVFSTECWSRDRTTLICHHTVALFYLHVVDLEETQADPGAEPPCHLR